MKYINVINKLSVKNSTFDPIPLSIKQSDGCLISLNKNSTKEDLVKKKFDKTPKIIRTFINNHILNNTSLWIDSGGYDVLANKKMSKSDIDLYIEYYVNYLRKFNDDFDYIFSLDFSISPKKNHWFNTEDNIYDFNDKSIKNIVEALKENPDLANKLYFVYQFKTKYLFDIWEKLYKKNDLESIVKNRAIGGIVSIYRNTKPKKKSKSGNLLFSPIIGPAFKCFYDYLHSKNIEQCFRLHFLGVSNLIDRFTILLLEKYFDRYFHINGANTKSYFTYDTSGYSHTASKRYAKTEIYHYDKNNVNRYKHNIRFDPDIRYVSEDKLSSIYSYNLEFLLSEINDKTSWEERTINIDQFIPLIIYSNKNIDNYFDLFIENNKFIDVVFSAKHSADVISDIDKIFEKFAPIKGLQDKTIIEINSIKDDKYTQYQLFTEDFRQRVIGSCEYIFDFHTLLTGNKFNEEFIYNKLIKFINDINLEFNLL